MAKEIEAQFININPQQVIKRLHELGAVKQGPEKLYRRYAFSLPNKKEAFVRIRDEWEKITMTYKEHIANTVDGTIEIELIVQDFQEARQFLQAIGLKEKAYQETKRLSFRLDDVEFDINTWPGLKPFLEIEAPTPHKVKKYAKLLGLDWNKAFFGGVSKIYAHTYKITEDWINNHCPVLKFGELPPELSPSNMRDH